MEKLYYNYPILTFYTVCYHENITHHYHRNSNDDVTFTTSTEKIITHQESKDFRYSSWRDVSGVFLLNSEKFLLDENSNKVFIKLILDLDLDFADDITRFDYERQKMDFKNMNSQRDIFLDFTESLNVPGFSQYNLVKISNEIPAGFNICTYLIFTFLIPLIEFYKIYIDSFCFEQEYTLKKIVSTRYDLNADTEENRRRFDNLIPKINIYGNETDYNQAPKEYKKIYEMPTKEEICQARKIIKTNKIGSLLNEGKFEDNNQNNLGIEKQNFNNYNRQIKNPYENNSIIKNQIGIIHINNNNSNVDSDTMPMLQNINQDLYNEKNELKNNLIIKK